MSFIQFVKTNKCLIWGRKTLEHVDKQVFVETEQSQGIQPIKTLRCNLD